MPSWNAKNPSIRRILADVRELAQQPSDQYAARPMEENMFDWHFVIRGPKGTDFEGGVYHGRIILPSDYPFKPPAIMFLTPNGRWGVKEKICLSISSYHPEHWQPAWGVRTILEALISFIDTPADGAVGALEYSSEVRQQLARESQSYSHELMPELPPLREEVNGDAEAPKNRYAEQIKQMHMHKLQDNDGGDDTDGDADGDADEGVKGVASSAVEGDQTETKFVEQCARPLGNDASSSVSVVPTHADAADDHPEAPSPTRDDPREPTPQGAAVPTARPGNPARSTETRTANQPPTQVNPPNTQVNPSNTQVNAGGRDLVDRLLGHVVVVLVVAILAVLYKKALALHGVAN